jgi:hypothetical protein
LIKAWLEEKGDSLVKSHNTEQGHVEAPNILIIIETGSLWLKVYYLVTKLIIIPLPWVAALK